MRLLLPQRLIVLTITFGLMLAACGQATLQPSSPMASAPTSETTTASSVQTVDRLDGILQGQMPQGYHTLGADSAPVTLVNYSDFL